MGAKTSVVFIILFSVYTIIYIIVTSGVKISALTREIIFFRLMCLKYLT